MSKKYCAYRKTICYESTSCFLTPLAPVNCHSIWTTQEVENALADIGDWEPLCENLGAPKPVLNQLRHDSIHIGLKKKRCLEAYFNSNKNACWETVVQVVAGHPFYNRRLAEKIADENGIDYSSIAKDEL